MYVSLEKIARNSTFAFIGFIGHEEIEENNKADVLAI